MSGFPETPRPSRVSVPSASHLTGASQDAIANNRCKMAYNCARVYVGSYVGGGTNQFEELIECNYEVAAGAITKRRLQPTIVRGTNSEGTMFALDTFILLPKSETALVVITRGDHKFHVRLYKSCSSRKTMFRLRL
jgi:hypothetical protein